MDWFINRRGRWEDMVERITVMRALHLDTQDVVLDAGCGPGRLTIDVAKRCKVVHAVDFSPKSVEVVRRNALAQRIENVSTRVGDLTQRLDFPDSFFDKILSVEVIHHLPKSDWREYCLKEFFRVLRPGGLCSVMVFSHNIIRSVGKEGRFPNGLYIYYFDESELGDRISSHLNPGCCEFSQTQTPRHVDRTSGRLCEQVQILE
jgi:cyclopropane fatty-acyl-phospholipid synthase-like methyltransferase